MFVHGFGGIVLLRMSQGIGEDGIDRHPAERIGQAMKALISSEQGQCEVQCVHPWAQVRRAVDPLAVFQSECSDRACIQVDNGRFLALDAVFRRARALQGESVMAVDPLFFDIDRNGKIERMPGTPTPDGGDAVTFRNRSFETEAHAVRDESKNIQQIAFAGAVLSDKSGQAAESKIDIVSKAAKIRDADSGDHHGDFTMKRSSHRPRSTTL